MQEPDDRLAGDLVWELFPHAVREQQATPIRRILFGLACALLVILTWLLFPPLAVAVACLAVSSRDLQTSWRLARTVPDKDGGKVCSLFGYAWAAWQVGVTAFVLIFVAIAIGAWEGKLGEPPAAFVTSLMLWFGGFVASSALTAVGLVKAFRSGMRVWVGEGINQARTLLMAMLIVGFAFAVLGPICLWLVGAVPSAGGIHAGIIFVELVGMCGCMFGGPVVILIALDWISGRVVADRPAKFGPKVAAVGKWK